MKKVLLLLCFVAVASLAANATTTGYTVSFSPYCDGMQIASYTGILFGGTHINATCAGTNTFGGGFVHAAAGYTYYTGAAFDFGDPLFGLLGTDASLQFLIQITGTVKKPGKCGWVIYEGPDGVSNYLLNSGPCTLLSRPDEIRSVAGAKSSTSR